MTGVRDTSIESYHNIEASGYLSESEALVFEWFERVPQSTDKEISVMSELDINVVTARRNDLVKKGKIRECGKRLCKITGKHVIMWELGFQLPEKVSPECLSSRQMKNLQKLVLLANEYQLGVILNLVKRRGTTQ